MSADDRCKKLSYAGWSMNGIQCKRKATGEHGFCGIHSPEAAQRRRAKSDAEYAYRESLRQRQCAEDAERDRKLAVFPELLAALKNLSDCLDFNGPDTVRFEGFRIAARAAIAKAEGRS